MHYPFLSFGNRSIILGISHRVISLLSSVLLVQAAAPKGVWDQFNPAPASRVVSPSSIFAKSNSVSGDLKHGLILEGNGTSVSIDWGKEVWTKVLC